MRLKGHFRDIMTSHSDERGRLPFLMNDMVIEEQLCQMRCSYCLTEEYNLLMNVPDARLRLTTDWRSDWHSVLDAYHEQVDAPVLRISGGEFFWLRASTEFIAECCQRYETVQIITNGVFLNSQRLSALAGMGNAKLNISLDGHTPELNRHRLPPRQRHLYGLIMRNLDAAVEAGIEVDIQSVLTDANYAGQVDFAEFLKERYDKRVTLFFFPVRGQVARRMGPPPGHYLMPLVERYAEFSGVLPPKAYVEHLAEQVKTGIRTLPCAVPATMAQLFGNGEVSACPHAWVKPMGNVTADHRVLLNTYAAHQHYDLFLNDRPRFEFCKDCATPSDLVNLYLLGRVSDAEMASTSLYSGAVTMERLRTLRSLFAPVLKERGKPS